MANLLDIRRRIRSVKNTQQITRAMKTVSAAKLRRAQERVLAARPYADELKAILTKLAARVTDLRHPLLELRPEKHILLVVITADRGLCGGFNTNIEREAQSFMKTHGDQDVRLMTVGRKGRDYFRLRGATIIEEHVGIFSQLDFGHARAVGERIIELYSEAEIDSVYLAYNEFKSVIQQRLVVESLLPLGSSTFQSEETDGSEYIYEQPPEKIFAALLPQFIDIQVHRALLESAASEHGARMAAMETAARNAGEMIETLTLNMNRIRQAAITREIIEVVSGASA
jgi:F-type H+-transporting ATPase subunit gamma